MTCIKRTCKSLRCALRRIHSKRGLSSLSDDVSASDPARVTEDPTGFLNFTLRLPVKFFFTVVNTFSQYITYEVLHNHSHTHEPVCMGLLFRGGGGINPYFTAVSQSVFDTRKGPSRDLLSRST